MNTQIETSELIDYLMREKIVKYNSQTKSIMLIDSNQCRKVLDRFFNNKK
jgi:hypothetical protein